MGPALSVIVLNYNGRAWLDRCLGSLAAQQGAPTFEVILVDNASSDGSAEHVRRRHPTVRVVESGANLGFAAGNNYGATVAHGGSLVFLNNDTVAEADWLARLAAARAASGAAIVTSRIVFLDRPEVIDSAGDGYLLAGGAFKRGHLAAADAFAESREVFGACGAAFLIDRALFESLGGFEPRFFMVYEDVDLSYRARLAGHHVWFAGDAVVRHAGSATLGRASRRAVFYGQRNLEWTWLRNTPRRLIARTLAAHLAYSLAGVVHYIGRGQGLAAIAGKLSAIGSLRWALLDRARLQRGRLAAPEALAALMEGNWLGVKRREKSARLDLADQQRHGLAGRRADDA